jgi:hypothetical protein
MVRFVDQLGHTVAVGQRGWSAIVNQPARSAAPDRRAAFADWKTSPITVAGGA